MDEKKIVDLGAFRAAREMNLTEGLEALDGPVHLLYNGLLQKAESAWAFRDPDSLAELIALATVLLAIAEREWKESKG